MRRGRRNGRGNWEGMSQEGGKELEDKRRRGHMEEEKREGMKMKRCYKRTERGPMTER